MFLEYLRSYKTVATYEGKEQRNFPQKLHSLTCERFSRPFMSFRVNDLFWCWGGRQFSQSLGRLPVKQTLRSRIKKPTFLNSFCVSVSLLCSGLKLRGNLALNLWWLWIPRSTKLLKTDYAPSLVLKLSWIVGCTVE